ncbi:MAG: OadG family protein [Clostridiales bacterium]|nr:OadG family protein [Clostridiales bacterium]
MENWSEIALNVTICGLAIVFGALIMLVILISLFGKIMDAINKKSRASAAVPTQTSTPAPAPAPTPAAQADDGELIAVISAAVSAMYDGSGKQFTIRSVRPARRAGERPAWAAAGLRDNTRSF